MDNSRKDKMIAIGSDHGGYELKQAIMKHLEERNLAYKDYGCYNEASVDYPEYGKIVANCCLVVMKRNVFLASTCCCVTPTR